VITAKACLMQQSISITRKVEDGMEDAAFELYEALADHYHLIFEDWDKSIARQAATLNPLLHSVLPRTPLRILDCACGIGTQAIGFAQAGHDVVASDLSPAAIARAGREAETRGVSISFAVADMTSLAEVKESGFDVVAALDNALPHLAPAQLKQARPGNGHEVQARRRAAGEHPRLRPPDRQAASRAGSGILRCRWKSQNRAPGLGLAR
jgi:2-polyprenyl-3-methyl-5-hydroxy-6-metoxy-1,4-benzoquinol methylase